MKGAGSRTESWSKKAAEQMEGETKMGREQEKGGKNKKIVTGYKTEWKEFQKIHREQDRVTDKMGWRAAQRDRERERCQ